MIVKWSLVPYTGVKSLYLGNEYATRIYTYCKTLFIWHDLIFTKIRKGQRMAENKVLGNIFLVDIKVQEKDFCENSVSWIYQALCPSKNEVTRKISIYQYIQISRAIMNVPT